MRSPAPQGTDLAIVAALGLCSLFLVALPTAVWLEAVAALLLVFVLPGYAVAAAIFLPGDLRPDVRATLVVVFSVACTALGGLLLQVFVPLDHTIFAALLLVTTAAGLAVAARRRVLARSSRETRALRIALPGIPALAALLVAVAMTGSAIAIATAGQHRQFADEHFTALWMLPEAKPGTNPPGAPLRVTVVNHEGETVTYKLRVQQGSRKLGQWRLAPPASHKWSTTVSLPDPEARAPVVAALFHDGSPYRRVALVPGTER